MFEAVLTVLADQRCVDMEGAETKDKVLENVKNAVVKKWSVFLYRKDFHELKQSRGENPERFAARTKQLAPACKFTTDSGTPKYGADIRSTIFVLGLEYSYIYKRKTLTDQTGDWEINSVV